MKKQTQNQRLIAYLKKNRKGITTMEAFRHLGITCLHKRISEVEMTKYAPGYGCYYHITRTPEKTKDGARVIRYSLSK